jgi:hypothetical protein
MKVSEVDAPIDDVTWEETKRVTTIRELRELIVALDRQCHGLSEWARSRLLASRPC